MKSYGSRFFIVLAISLSTFSAFADQAFLNQDEVSLETLATEANGTYYSTTNYSTNRAYSVQLLRVTSNAMPGVLNVALNLDSYGNMVSLLTVGSDGTQMVLSSQQLRYGVVLYRQQNRDAVILQSSNFGNPSGASFTLRYLSNGMTGEYRQYNMNLVRLGNSFSLETLDRRAFKNMYMTARTVFGNPVGIQGIQVW